MGKKKAGEESKDKRSVPRARPKAKSKGWAKDPMTAQMAGRARS